MRAIFVCFTQTSLSDIPNGQIKYLLSLHERPPPVPKLQIWPKVVSPQGFIEVDTAASPEEKHVANMQINGWDLICICICICREAYD